MPMRRKRDLKKNLEKISELLKKKKEIEKEKQQVVSDLFKYETLYLDMTQGLPLTKTSEFYVNSRVEKKKISITEKDRIFSIEYPKN